MAVNTAIPTWLNHFTSDTEVEWFGPKQVLRSGCHSLRIKYADNTLESALLQREALWLSRLTQLGFATHRCHSFAKDGHKAVLQTSYIRGQSLAQTIYRYQGEEKLVLRLESIITTMLTGLQSLHKLGIVHGDIKPGNILLGEDSQLYFIDFSNARRHGEPLVERGIAQSTISYRYPRSDHEARYVHDYYALLITISLLVGEIDQSQFNHLGHWQHLLDKRLCALGVSSEVSQQLAVIWQRVGDDLA